MILSSKLEKLEEEEKSKDRICKGDIIVGILKEYNFFVNGRGWKHKAGAVIIMSPSSGENYVSISEMKMQCSDIYSDIRHATPEEIAVYKKAEGIC